MYLCKNVLTTPHAKDFNTLGQSAKLSTSVLLAIHFTLYIELYCIDQESMHSLQINLNLILIYPFNSYQVW